MNWGRCSKMNYARNLACVIQIYPSRGGRTLCHRLSMGSKLKQTNINGYTWVIFVRAIYSAKSFQKNQARWQLRWQLPSVSECTVFNCMKRCVQSLIGLWFEKANGNYRTVVENHCECAAQERLDPAALWSPQSNTVTIDIFFWAQKWSRLSDEFWQRAIYNWRSFVSVFLP